MTSIDLYLSTPVSAALTLFQGQMWEKLNTEGFKVSLISDPIEFKLCVVVTCIAQNVQVPVLSASTKWTTPLCTECFTWLCNAFLVCGYLWQRQCRLLLMFFCQYYMIFTHQCTSAWYAVSFCVVCAARVVTKITIQSHKHRHLVVCVMKESEVI